uniref:F-box domain-containing protein n=1 Tax=Macrostomum lignano TaxID=282301 RepID=A0A1I8JDA9_9PLAT
CVDTAAATEAAAEHESAGWFGACPPELLLRILGRLDLLSLLRLGNTCRLLQRHCRDPLLYTELRLRPHSIRVCDASLSVLEHRTGCLTGLDMSWCGTDGAISPGSFCRLLLGTCLLTDLRLANCKFLDDACLAAIGRSGVGQAALLDIIAANPGLLRLRLSSCARVADFNPVAEALARHCPNLRSVDFWRSGSLSSRGLLQLAEGCAMLEELDLGWCSRVESSSGCFLRLASQCCNLRKLFLTANRTVCDTDLKAIALHCKQLQQLDILGTNQVTFNILIEVLQSCPKLELFDVSFCAGINKDKVHQMRHSFPHCSIQMSFQAESCMVRA